MRTSFRYSAVACIAAAVLFSGCAGGGGSSLPAGAPAPQQPAVKSATIQVGTTAAQALPAIDGITSTITLPSVSSGGNAALTVTLSTGAPSNLPPLAANQPHALLYFTLQSSSAAAFNGVPKFQMTLPSAPKSQGQYYAWMYDAARNVWTDLAPITVSGTNVTFGGTAKPIQLASNAHYVVIPFTAAPQASCPTPAPTPTPTPTPPPISGKWFNTTQDSNLNNGAFNTFDEQTGQQLATLNLNYPNGVFGSSIALSKDGGLAYVAGYGPLVNGNPSTFPLPGLTIVNTATNSIVHQTTIDGGVDTGALSPDGTRYYGAGEDVNGNEFFIFDASTGALLKTISTPTQFFQVVVNPSGTTAYLPGNNNIYAVNLTTDTLGTLCSGCQGALAIDATGTKLFSINQSGIVILNAATGAQIGSIAKPSNVYMFMPGNTGYFNIEAGNLGSFVVGENNNDGSDSYAVVSTSSDSIVSTFAAQPYLGGWTPAVNYAGTYAVLMTNGGESSIAPVGAVALPNGQLYFYDTMPVTNFYDAAAAQ